MKSDLLVRNTGRLRVSTESFAIYAAISVLAVPLAVANQLTGRILALAIYTGVSVTCITGIYLFAAGALRDTYLKKIPPNKEVALNLILIASAGAIRGWMIYLSFEWLQISQPSVLPVRILTSTATTMFWLLLISILVEDTRNFKNRFDSMFRDSILAFSRDPKKSTENPSSRKLQRDFEDIENILNSVLDQTVRSAYDRQTLIRAAANVRTIVEDVIRPLSHRLWIQTNESLPKFRLGATVYDSIRNLRISPAVASGFLFLLALFNLPVDFGVAQGLIGATSIAILTYIVFKFINKIRLVQGLGNALVNLMLLVAAGFVVSFGVYILNHYIFDLSISRFSFIFMVLIPMAGIISSVRESTKADRDLLLESMVASLGEIQLSTQERATSQNMASFLHNSLQSELMALSYQLEDAAVDPYSEKSKALLEKIGARINRSISEDFKDFLEDPLQRLHRIKAAWSGIAKVELSLPDNLNLDLDKLLLLVQIVEEAINNAVRAGGAKNIEVIAAEKSNKKLLLIIKNDGIFDENATEGFGTQWLDQRVGSQWSRRRVDGFTVLEIVL